MRKKTLLSLTVLMVLLISGLIGNVTAQEDKDKTSHLTVPWDEFKKILRIDENEIILPLDTFQKLLAQTGTTIKPRHSVKDGQVIITRAEFQKLVNQMKPPVEFGVKPPFDFLITKSIIARFSFEVSEKNSP